MYAPIFRGWFCKERHILLQMDLTSDCQLHCIHCFRYSDPPQLPSFQAGDVQILEKEVFPYVDVVNLSTVGEPLMSPVLPETISAAKRAGVARIGMTTNGILLTGGMARDLLKRGLNWLAVSVDAATRETYEDIRRGGGWDVLMENLIMLKEQRSRTPGRMSLALNYTIMDRNAGEAAMFPSLARQLGADSVSFLPLTIEREEMKSWSLFYTPARWNRLMRDLRLTVARVGIPAIIPDDLPEGEVMVPTSTVALNGGLCPAVLESWIFLTSDGNCYPCPNVVSEGSFGNVFKIPFKEIWDSLGNQEFRQRAMERGQVPGCDHCKLFALRKAPAQEGAYLSKHLVLDQSDGNRQPIAVSI